MQLLLDTHTLIWFLNGDLHLSQSARTAIETAENECFVSHASIWEIAIKNSLGKLDLTKPLKELKSQLDDNGLDIYLLGFEHFLLVNQLPFHHKDPFDRLLIALAMVEQLTIVTKDPLFPPYGVPLLW